MTSKDRKRQSQQRARNDSAARDAADKGHAPAGRGGAAMGRTVGLPYGGARPRKRRSERTKGDQTH